MLVSTFQGMTLVSTIRGKPTIVSVLKYLPLSYIRVA